MYPYVRSNEMMRRTDTALIVVDLQERLLPALFNADVVEWNTGRLLRCAETFGVPVLATEQYPKGLGSSVPSLAPRLGDPVAKVCFSCVEADAFREQLVGQSHRKLLLCGAETHVCIQQTALDLLSLGYTVYLAADATGARSVLDHDLALRRMENCGVIVTTTETALFEWCEQASGAEFKAVRELVMEEGPRSREK